MSVALPTGLPARPTLLAEGIEVLDRDQVRSWGRRPLRLCLVNLMPNKAVTETQVARLLGATSIPVELTLCLPDGYRSKSTPTDHMALYRPWTSIRDEPFDALVVTGAPIEALPFEDVTYWPGLCAVFDWARAHSIGSFYICWAAQAALYHYHGVPKHRLPQKTFGVFRQQVADGGSRLLRGFGEEFPVPVSRHTEVRAADLPTKAGLAVLASSPDTGLCLVEDRGSRAVYMLITWSTTPRPYVTSSFATGWPASPSASPVATSPTTTHGARRPTSGGPTAISCSPIGSVRSAGRLGRASLTNRSFNGRSQALGPCAPTAPTTPIS